MVYRPLNLEQRCVAGLLLFYLVLEIRVRIQFCDFDSGYWYSRVFIYQIQWKFVKCGVSEFFKQLFRLVIVLSFS